MTGAYLGALLVSAAGVLAIDLRWRLLLGARRSPLGTRLRVLGVVGAGAALLLVWDVVAIRAGFYGRGLGDALVGVEVAPHLPVEELVFVVFLAYVTLVVAAGMLRSLGQRRAPRPTSSTAAHPDGTDVGGTDTAGPEAPGTPTDAPPPAGMVPATAPSREVP